MVMSNSWYPTDRCVVTIYYVVASMFYRFLPLLDSTKLTVINYFRS